MTGQPSSARLVLRGRLNLSFQTIGREAPLLALQAVQVVVSELHASAVEGRLKRTNQGRKTLIHRPNCYDVLRVQSVPCNSEYLLCRKISVREFKGKQLIDIREFYEVRHLCIEPTSGSQVAFDAKTPCNGHGTFLPKLQQYESVMLLKASLAETCQAVSRPANLCEHQNCSQILTSFYIPLPFCRKMESKSQEAKALPFLESSGRSF